MCTSQYDKDNDYIIIIIIIIIIPNSAKFRFLEGLSQKPSYQEQKQHNI